MHLRRVRVMSPRPELESATMPSFPDPINRLPRAAEWPDARLLEANGCRVVFASFAASDRIPVQHHATENVGVVTQGEMLLTLHGVERSLRAGHWYHVPAQAPHAARFGAASATVEFRFSESPHVLKDTP